MKFVYTILFLSLTTAAFAKDFGEVMRAYGEKKRELVKLLEQKAELEKKIEAINKEKRALAAEINSTPEELDAPAPNYEPEHGPRS